MLDGGIERLQERRFAQGRDRIGWSPGPERLANASNGASCCGAAEFEDWDMART